jgi:hypothetical protein
MQAEFGEFRTAMVEGGHIHCPQHPVGHVGGARNLQEMPSGMHGHVSSFPGSLIFVEAPEYQLSNGLSRVWYTRCTKKNVGQL